MCFLIKRQTLQENMGFLTLIFKQLLKCLKTFAKKGVFRPLNLIYKYFGGIYERDLGKILKIKFHKKKKEKWRYSLPLIQT